MNEEKMVALEAKIDAILRSVERTRKYFQWMLILTICFFVLPLIALVFAVPFFLNFLSLYGDLGL